MFVLCITSLFCVQHRIWATPDKIDQVDYALNLSVDLMLYFEDELQMNFHLPKLGELLPVR